MIKPLACVIAAAAALGLPARAQERTELERTQILGNRELPRVLYIVPWKQPVPSPPSGKPLPSVLDEAPAAVDRAVLLRQIDYSALLQQSLAPPGQPSQPGRKTNAPTGETR